MPTYEAKVSDYKWGKFKKKFKEYEKKAEKLGFPKPTYKVIQDFGETAKGFTPLSHVYRFRILEITYEMPIIDGWEVVGNRERIDGKIFTNVVTNDDCTCFHKSELIGCGHCHTNRYRNKSILLKNKVNTIIEVGSTCVIDFFGHKVTNLDWFMERPFEASEWSNVGGGTYSFNLEQVLKYASFYIRKFGYQKASGTGEGTYNTKERVWDCHLEAHFRSTQFVKPEVSEEDEKMALDTICHWKGMNAEENYSNSYVTNLIKIAQSEYMDPKLLGYAVSMVSSYQMYLEKRAAINAPVKISKFQGQIKDRIKGLPVKLTFKKGWETMYGWTDLLSFTDLDGNVYVTFYKGTKSTPEQGQNVILDGTIVDHTEYKNVEQTIVNRIAWRSV